MEIRYNDVYKHRSLRPCFVDGEYAFFHGWFQTSQVYAGLLKGEPTGIINRPAAIVEFEDGHVEEVHSDKITFVDSGKMFYEYDWP